ncbi:MAG: protein-disulfide reductase DsbD family protein, partial [Hyphomonadaceae bacterium]
ILGRVTPTATGGQLTFVGAPVRGARDVHFFPNAGDVIDHAAPENPSRGALGVALEVRPARGRDLGALAFEGVLTLEQRGPQGWAPAAYEVRVEPGAPLPGAAGARARPAAGAVTLPLALALAFAGGLLLNLMPCVLPVLSIKALSFARSAAGDARRTGLFFLAGVMATFLGLAGVMIALKAGGAAVGWGFQLQTPLAVAALATLFFLIGLNFLGAFEIDGRWRNVGHRLVGKEGGFGAFFTGALAVIAATPCTAPFMAAATGFAAAQPPAAMLSVFGALGLGFAAPFVALAFSPPLVRRLPKPGPWMAQLKTALAFPMFATAAWLAWVIARQAGPDALIALLAALTTLAFAIVVGRWGPRWRIAGVIVLALALALTWRPIVTGAAGEAARAPEAWSEARVEALINQGHGVFVDFTAAWCVTCQVNKLTVLSRPAIARAFAERDVVLLEADWTRRDAAIAAALAEHGRDGVPLYLYYPPGSPNPRILPQILTEGIVMRALRERAP